MALGILTATAQRTDTLTVSLPAAEQRLLQQNLALLVQRTNVEAARAEVITARLFDNPEVTFENVLYNHTTGKWMDFSYEGQNALQVQQVFKLAGKRNKAIRMAQSGVKMSEYQLFDLLRTLRFQLHDNFYDLYYKQQSLATYGEQIGFLQTVVKAFEAQQRAGNMAPKEVIRLKSLLYELQHEQLQLLQDVQQLQADMALLLRYPATSWLQPQVPADSAAAPSVAAFTYTQLADTARLNRYDLKSAGEAVHYQQLNLQLQKAMAVPDVQMGLSYDKQGNFERNYNGLSISMPLPFLNRNQGNIKMAKATLESSRLQLQSQEDVVAQEVMTGYRQALQAEQLVAAIDPAFADDYTQLMREVEKNYRQHNIGLLEFIDLYDAYRQHLLNSNTLQYERASALETLNFTTGSTIFHP